MEDDISQLLINSHKKAQRAATEEQMVESGAMGAWNGTRLEIDTMSNPAQQQQPNRYKTVMILGSNKAIIKQSQIVRSLDTKSAPYGNGNERIMNKS